MTHLLRSLLYGAVLAMILATTASSAYAVNVACNGDTTDDATPSDHKKISDLLADNTTITITDGPCVLHRSLNIFGFVNLNIEAEPSEQAVLALPLGGCAPASPPAGFVGSPVISVTETRNVNLRRLTLRGGGTGVFMNESVVTMQSILIELSRGDGVNLGQTSTLNLMGAVSGPGPVFTDTKNEIRDNCSNGVNVGEGGVLSASGNNHIHRNGFNGISVSGGRANLNACCVADTPSSIVIENNARGVQAGPNSFVNLTSGTNCAGTPGLISIKTNKEQGATAFASSLLNLTGRVIVDGNNTAPTSPLGLKYPSGVLGDYNATVFLGSGVQVKNTNNAPGVLADTLTAIRLGSLMNTAPPAGPCTPPSFTGPVITGNQGGGVVIEHTSTLELLGGSSIAISGNTSSDVACDKSSLVYGDLSGIGKHKCSNMEKE